MLETCLAIIVNVNVNQNLIFAQLISKQQNHIGFTQNDLTKKYHHFYKHAMFSLSTQNLNQLLIGVLL